MKYVLCLLLCIGCTRPGPSCRDTLAPSANGGVHPVAGQLAAYNDRHIDLFVSYFHPEVELFVHGEPAPFVKGSAALRESYSKMFKASPLLHCELERRIAVGDFVIDEERVSGLRGGPPVHAVAIYEVKGGKIVKAWFLRGR
ncbi:MAG: hypothetical protein CVU65_00345 [Deltaproteobacteria bacterium HGW-Deltaproteobacteria-22]|jgi:hypothetical protein|nr:MAG: hypothetical protein CVU65_00345 [Deltaproteobacteria bacterium HGW-Deltaproteobacteria-22]